MYHDGVRVDRPLIPDAFVYLFRGEDPSGILHQESENLKFDRRQLCRLFVHRDFHGILVQLQSADDINVALFLLFLCLQHIQILLYRLSWELTLASSSIGVNGFDI